MPGPRHTAKVPFFVVCIALAHGKGAIVCRVPGAWHTANSRLFAVCQGLGTRQTAYCLPCGKPLRHTANALFNGVPSIVLYFAVGPEKHSAKCLPCARNIEHGKQALCRPLYAVSCLPCVTLGKHFAECRPAFAVCHWHTANRHSPVGRSAQASRGL